MFFGGLGGNIEAMRTDKAFQKCNFQIKGFGGWGKGNDGSQAVMVTVGQRDALLAQPSLVIGRSRLVSLTSADSHPKD